MNKITSDNYHTFTERLETILSWKDHLPNWLSRNEEYNKRLNIIGVRTTYIEDQDPLKQWFYTFNQVTNDGDRFYAEQAVNAALTNDFLAATNRAELGNAASPDSIAKADTYSALGSPITASRKAITATYPLVSDPDGDNTGGGADIASWDYSWLTTDFDTESANNIQSGVIHIGGAAPVGGTVLLTHYNFATAFEKTASDTLKVFHNHTFNGS